MPTLVALYTTRGSLAHATERRRRVGCASTSEAISCSGCVWSTFLSVDRYRPRRHGAITAGHTRAMRTLSTSVGHKRSWKSCNSDRPRRFAPGFFQALYRLFFVIGQGQGLPLSYHGPVVGKLAVKVLHEGLRHILSRRHVSRASAPPLCCCLRCSRPPLTSYAEESAPQTNPPSRFRLLKTEELSTVPAGGSHAEMDHTGGGGGSNLT